MITTHYSILDVSPSADLEEIRRAYRAKVKKHHPDHGGDANLLLQVNEAYAVLSNPDKRARYDRLGTSAAVTIRSKSHAYELGTLIAEGDLADLLAAEDETGAAVVLKGVRDPKNADLLANESARLLAFETSLEAKYLRYLPRLRDSFATRDSSRMRRSINALEHLDGWTTLHAVRSRLPNLQFEHGVWMFNRMLEALGFIHRSGVVHGAILPPHAMVYSSTTKPSEWDHGLKLVDWCYSVDAGSPLRAIAPQWRSFYPPEVFEKGPATPATDIYMAAKTIVYVLGGNPLVPSYLGNFLRGCSLGNPSARPQDAWELHAEFKRFMSINYGPKRYVPFILPTTN